MDIPLPDDTPFSLDQSVVDIPVPEDVNRYSPSLPIEDDPTDFPNDISEIELPKSLPKTEESGNKPVVLGKLAAKKRLLAFSAAKLSFGVSTQTVKGKKDDTTKEAPKENILKKKKRKKGVLDKARDTISEIEELKRKENQLRESMQLLYPMWGTHTTPNMSQPLLIRDAIETSEKTSKSENLVDMLLEKKAKRDKEEQERKKKEEERKERKERKEKEREKEKQREKQKRREAKPRSWTEFKKAGHKVYHFRRVKYKWDKLIEHSRSKRRSRSVDRDKSSRSVKKINLLETPMELKPSLMVETNQGTQIEFPSWCIKYTKSIPSVSYSMNPASASTMQYISREKMLNSLPSDIFKIVSEFLTTVLQKWWLSSNLKIVSLSLA